MRRLIMTASIAALMSVPRAAFAAVEDVQLWSTVALNGSIGGKLIGGLELQARLERDIGRLGTVIVRPTIGVQIDEGLAILAGYARVITVVDEGRDTQEDRTFQQINWRIASGRRGTLSSRTRLEQRFVSVGNDVGYRLRTQLRYQRPISKRGLAVVIAVEPLVALNTTDWGARAGLDQVRGSAGLSIPLTSRIAFEPSYLHRYAVRRSLPDRSDHVVSTTLAIRF